MVASKERCGRAPQDTSETGEITARRDLVSNSIKTETSMKECGLWIRSMDREHTGEMTVASSEENIQVIGLRTKSMAGELSISRIVIDMMDIGSTVCHKVRVE